VRSKRGALFLVSIAATGLVLILVEGLASWTYSLEKAWAASQPERPERAHSQYDSELGWVNQPGVHVSDLYGPGKDFTTNARGFRAQGEYAETAPPGFRRVVFLGDSFTMGYGVGDDETFPSVVERLEPSIQAINMGMGAYGVGQDYLWYQRDGRVLHGDLLVFALISHDFVRMTLSYYMAPKPILAATEGKLQVHGVPVPRTDGWERAAKFARQLGWRLDVMKALRLLLRPLTAGVAARPDSRPKKFEPVARAIFATLAEQARARGTGLLLVHLPSRSELLGDEPDLGPWMQQLGHTLGIPCVALRPFFEARWKSGAGERLYLPNRHYSAEGNRLVAEALLPAIQAALARLPRRRMP